MTALPSCGIIRWRITERWVSPEIWAIDPQDSAYYRYEDRQFLRKDSFAHAAHGISFDMNRIKDQLD
jgi:hypothetical protein